MTIPAHRFSSEKVVDILSLSRRNATAIYTGEDIIIQMANDAMISFWGKDRQVIGLPLETAVPELEGQPFIAILQNVWRTGTSYEDKNAAAELVVDGKLQTFYFDFIYEAITNEEGQIDCILHTATDVTERNTNLKALADAQKQKEALDREQTLNEQLLKSQKHLNELNNDLEKRVLDRTKELLESKSSLQHLNAELAAINEEQKSVNEELQQTEIALWQANRELHSSETRLDQILTQLPAPVVVLSGPNQIIETTNEALLRFWDKKQEEVIGKPMLEVFPEMKGQPFPALWKKVYETGETIINREKPVMFNRPGGLRIFYVDYHYQPLKDPDGNITGVLATIIDNTDKVMARKQVEESEERLNLIIDSADLGTWYINAATREFTPSLRLKELFGYLPDEEMPYEAAINQIAPDHRETVKAAVEAAITRKESYDLEYPIVGHHDGKLRWVRATGKLYVNKDGTYGDFSGTVADITERKGDEQRKNDFIGMVSHELKTPLTSISGYVQLLQNKINKTEDNFTATILEKTNNQVKKMTTMINGFLNISRLESGKIHLDKSDFLLDDLVVEMIEEAAAIYPRHTLSFHPCQPIMIHADRNKIGNVVTNLLSNAVKYSPNDRNIEIQCEIIGNKARVSVKDSGIGISPENVEKLFERFFRVKGDSSVSGFGIGLYLSAEIVYRHQGEIWVESEPGKGSTFLFTLPV